MSALNKGKSNYRHAGQSELSDPTVRNLYYRLLVRNKDRHSSNNRQPRSRTTLLAIVSIVCLIYFLWPRNTTRKLTLEDDLARRFKGEGGPRVAKACMLYGSQNPLYERAVRSHRVHNELHNYPMHVLRHEITGGYWNKPSYLLSLVVNELAKAPDVRAEWIM